MKMTMMTLVLMFGMSNVSLAKENSSANAEAVNTACSQEASSAGCGTEKVGSGLLKCLRKYKKENKEFKFSDGCKSAMKTLRADKKSRE